MDVYSVLRHTGYISNGEVVFRKNAEICNVTITKAGKTNVQGRLLFISGL